MSALGMPHTIRSWLGNRRTSGTKPHSPKGTIMKKLFAVTLIALTLSTTAASCTSGNKSALPTASPSVTACEESDPCWDPAQCETNGNGVCGVIDDSAYAWKVWKEQNGAHKLKMDPSRPFRVEYMASSDDSPENMDGYDLALLGKDGRYYVFRASYLD